MKALHKLVFFISLLLSFTQIQAHDDYFYGGHEPSTGYGLGIGAGSLGLSGEINVGMSRYFSISAVLNTLDYTPNFKADDIRYKGEMDWRSQMLLLNLYPFGGQFHLTFGAVHNDNNYYAHAVATDGDFNSPDNFIGGPIHMSEVGGLESQISFPDYVPYAGIGWGGNSYDNGHFGINIALGVLYQSSAHATPIRPTDMAAFSALPGNRQAQITADLERLHNDFRRKADKLPFYPVASIHLFMYI